MSDALRLEGLRKRYGRRGPWALDGLTASFPRGAICGLVGPNGAGKTTLFSVICGFLPPDDGVVDILGEGAFDPWRFKGRVGILPQDAELNPRSTCLDFLLFMARLQGLDAATAEATARRELEAVDLGDRSGALIGSLSHGMRRRLATASALLGEPELVLLDEPTAGLDPVQALRLRERLVRDRGRGTLVISSHNLDELERICDHVVFVEAGRCAGQGAMHALTGAGEVQRWQLAAPPDLEALQATAPGHLLRWHGDGTLEQRAPAGADLDAATLALTGELVRQGIALRGLRRGESLEERFIRGGDAP